MNLAIISTKGMSTTPFYRRWCDMRQRCNNLNHPAFKHYGGRGITVCEDWAVFSNFYLDMFSTYAENLTLDRIDNSKGYSKNNCAWVSQKENCANRRSNNWVETPNGKMLITHAASLFDIDVALIRYRIRKNLPIDSVFSTPKCRGAK